MTTAQFYSNNNQSRYCVQVLLKVAQHAASWLGVRGLERVPGASWVWVPWRRTPSRIAAPSIDWAMVQMGSAPWTCRKSLPAGLRLQGINGRFLARNLVRLFYPETTTFQNHRLAYRRKKGQNVNIFSEHNKAFIWVKGEGKTIRMVPTMFLGTEYGRRKLPILGTAKKCRLSSAEFSDKQCKMVKRNPRSRQYLNAEKEEN